MDNNNLNSTPDDASFSVEAILAEYEAERSMSAGFEPPIPPPDSSNHIVYDSREQAIGEAGISSELPQSRVRLDDEIPAPEPELPEDEPVLKQLYSPAQEQKANDEFFASPMVEEAEPELAPPTHSREKTAPVQEQEPAFEFSHETPGTIDELIAEVAVEESSDELYAVQDDYEVPPRHRSSERVPDFKEKVLGPIIGMIAASSMRREEKRKAEYEKRKAAPKVEVPELRADRAAAFYAAQADSIRMRSFIASALTIVLVYLSYGLPAFGLLGSNPAVRAIVCLVLMLAVVVVGLDIFTNGLLSLVRRKPGAESLIVVSCLVTAVDAIVIALTGDTVAGLPFCAVSALSVTFALWGAYLSCKNFAMSFATAASADNPSVVMAVPGVDEQGSVLIKAKRPIDGFVRTAEAADGFENAFRIIAPILIIGSLILSLFCFIASKACDNFLHTFAACTAACASFSAVFGFAFLFSVVAKRLVRSGVAIAGYAGTADLGRIDRVLVTDTDVFPVRTLSIADISIAESARPDTVISYTGSMIAASGMGIAPIFTELMRKNACSMQKIEDFACHEGGGLVARVNGDLVYVGSSGFMQLMGIRLPKGAAAKSSVFTAINDSLSGIFAIGYKPVASVQRALVSLLRSKKEPLFAIRDFNITPMLVKQKFRLPNDRYDFPSFADRYRISSPEIEETGTVAAVFSRGGLNSVAGLATRGQKLYNRLRLSLAISLLGTIVGLVLMLALCWSGSFTSASCGNLMTFMLLWLAPTFVVSLGLRN